MTSYHIVDCSKLRLIQRADISRLILNGENKTRLSGNAIWNVDVQKKCRRWHYLSSIFIFLELDLQETKEIKQQQDRFL